MAGGQGRYSHNVWNRQEALRLQQQQAASEKAAERERKLQETAAGKAEAERLNADLAARVAQLESILGRGLDREAAIDLNAMVRHDEFPPLDLGAYGVAARARLVDLCAGAGRHRLAFRGQGPLMNSSWLLLVNDFERAEIDYARAEAARQERIRERTSRYEAALWRTRMMSRAITAR